MFLGLSCDIKAETEFNIVLYSSTMTPTTDFNTDNVAVMWPGLQKSLSLTLNVAPFEERDESFFHLKAVVEAFWQT